MLASILSVIQCNTISMKNSQGLPEGFPEYWPIIVACLVFLLCFRELLYKSTLKEKSLETSLDMGIYPLLYAFFAVILFKIAEILNL